MNGQDQLSPTTPLHYYLICTIISMHDLAKRNLISFLAITD